MRLPTLLNPGVRVGILSPIYDLGYTCDCDHTSRRGKAAIQCRLESVAVIMWAFRVCLSVFSFWLRSVASRTITDTSLGLIALLRLGLSAAVSSRVSELTPQVMISPQSITDALLLSAACANTITRFANRRTTTVSAFRCHPYVTRGLPRSSLGIFLSPPPLLLLLAVTW